MDKYIAQEKLIKRTQEFIDKNIVRASTTKQAQSRRKQLERMEKLEKPTVIKDVHFKFPFSASFNSEALNVRKLNIGYTKPILPPIDLKVMFGEKIVIVGANGVGKSTFIKTILDIIPSLGGNIKMPFYNKPLYFEQEYNGKLDISAVEYFKEKYKEVASIIKSNTNNWIYLLTADNDTAKEISTRLGKYTTSSSRVSVSSRISSIDDNISNDKSLLGRELLMPEELIRFQFGEGLFLKTRMFPVKTYLKPIQEYNIKIKKAIIPKKEIVYVPECFDLNKFRERKVIEEMDNRVELQ